MPPRRPDPRGGESVTAVLRALDAGASPDPGDQRAAARYLLYTLAARHPGRVLEVRIPPVAAVQCLPGPVHTRGTPPNVVETDPLTWIRLAAGRSTGPTRSVPAPFTRAARVRILALTCRLCERYSESAVSTGLGPYEQSMPAASASTLTWI